VSPNGPSPARPGLAVWIEGVRVGLLRVGEGGWQFRYDPQWLSYPACYPISPHLPLQPAAFQDEAKDRTVQWFFDNLLPEGGVREALARYARIAEDDAFGLLARFGDESAGALTLLPDGAPFPAAGSYHPLSFDELRRLLADLPSVPLIAAGGRARMSLAGAQHKLGLHRREQTFLLPDHAASSLVIKPDNARKELFPLCPANEHFCVSLARRVGLAAPRSELQHIPEPIYVVERFDRRVDEAGRVERLHQIDLCQLLNRWAGYKYEAEGGITFGETFRALDRTRQPAVSRNQLLRWLIFNYVIGNSDAHAKNVAFLLSEAGVSLAPAYDLVCVAVYGPDFDYMAMTIAEEVRYGWVEARHWDRLGASIGIAPAFLRRLRLELGRTIPAAAREVLKDPAFTDEERAFLARVVEVIDRHAGYLLEGIG
jgi:serine/threonine-protein kinase HipA